MTDRAASTLVDIYLAQQVSASAAGGTTVGHQKNQRHATRFVAADANSAATGIYRLAKFDRPVNIISYTIAEEAAVASNTSNYLTWTLIQDNDAASGTLTCTVAAGVNTSTVATVAQSSRTSALDASNFAIVSGNALYAQLAKAGTGVSRTAVAVIDVIYEEV
jgi:hypothetical protein